MLRLKSPSTSIHGFYENKMVFFTLTWLTMAVNLGLAGVDPTSKFGGRGGANRLTITDFN